MAGIRGLFNCFPKHAASRAADNYAAGAAAFTHVRPPWDETILTEALKKMETSLERAASYVLAPATQPPPIYPAAKVARAQGFDFDLFEVPYDDLPTFAFSVLVLHPSLSSGEGACPIDREKLWRYVVAVAAHYHQRPFHSFRHAVDVLLATNHLISLIKADRPEPFSSPLEVACLLISALVHDTDHPGVMNSFMLASKHPVSTAATSQGDGWFGSFSAGSTKAILETHHAGMAIALLQRPELDFTQPLAAGDRERFVALLRENVLNTYDGTTPAKAAEFSALLLNGDGTASESMPSAAQVMCMVIKAADISNPVRPLKVYEKWIDGVMSEFFTQVSGCGGNASKQRPALASQRDSHPPHLFSCFFHLFSPHLSLHARSCCGLAARQQTGAAQIAPPLASTL